MLYFSGLSVTIVVARVLSPALAMTECAKTAQTELSPNPMVQHCSVRDARAQVFVEVATAL